MNCNIKDITGQRFGKLVALESIPRDKGKQALHWRCVCDCGNFINVRGDKLRCEIVISCGCSPRSKIGRKQKSDTPIYNVWRNMISRCEKLEHPAYYNYGGRGITVCDEWHDFLVFREWALLCGYEEGLTIDRIDNDGNYTSENCRWVTQRENNKNTRRTHFITYQGETKCIAEWAEELGIPDNTMRGRLFRYKEDPVRALEIPYIPKGPYPKREKR